MKLGLPFRILIFEFVLTKMKEQLVVKNFGPIIDIAIEIKDFNIFIGTTSSGKSTIAKLVSIFKSDQLHFRREWMTGSEQEKSELITQFNKLLALYNIEFSIGDKTYIRYQSGEMYCEIRSGFAGSTFTPYNVIPSYNPVYIPAERVFFSTLSQSIFSLISSDVSLPKWLLDFGKRFENARRDVKSFNIEFLKAKYRFSDGNDILELENNKTIKLSQGSSGIQSILPLMLVIQHLTEERDAIRKEMSYDLFVVEEPEMNLYPSSQKELLEFIMRRIKRSSDKLILTTHSPYLLTAMDNLVQAGNVSKEGESVFKELSAIVPKDLWIDYNQVTCYFFDKGHCKSTLDPELKSLGPSNIDDISTELGMVFDNLLKLKYQNNELR